MARAYLQKLRALLDRIDPVGGPPIECRHFFSGAAAYADGHIFMTMTPVGLALKLSEPSRAALMEMGGSPLRHFSNGPVKKDYVIVPDGLVAEALSLAPWVGESIEFVAGSAKPRAK
jgi:TfoX/Sxy family transcriptional regulator of competence genes